MWTKIGSEEFFTGTQIEWLENLHNYWYHGEDDEIPYVPFTEDEELAAECASLAGEILMDEETFIGSHLSEHMDKVRKYANHEVFKRVALMNLEFGAANELPACITKLGECYFEGLLVPQDVKKAIEYFTEGVRLGSAASGINLGRIYEEGLLGSADRLRAAHEYGRAALMDNSAEALWRLGDLMAQGDDELHDVLCAYHLYRKAQGHACKGSLEASRVALRLACMVSEPTLADAGIPYEPIRALGLFQAAEHGLRVYLMGHALSDTERLRFDVLITEAIDGQERMRLACAC